jgi:hypothetical protein
VLQVKQFVSEQAVHMLFSNLKPGLHSEQALYVEQILQLMSEHWEH